jgi:hypothetical protein
MALLSQFTIIVVSCLLFQAEKTVRSSNGGQVAAAGPWQAGQMVDAAGPAKVDFEKWEDQVFDMNPFLVSALICLGPGMAEGGRFKKLRDDITLHIALKFKVAPDMLAFENADTSLLARRLKLTMSQMQYAEQVCLCQFSRCYHRFIVMHASLSCDTASETLNLCFTVSQFMRKSTRELVNLLFMGKISSASHG